MTPALHSATEVRPRPEGGGGFAPAVAPLARLGKIAGGSGRVTVSAHISAVPGLTRDLDPSSAPHEAPDQVRGGQEAGGR